MKALSKKLHHSSSSDFLTHAENEVSDEDFTDSQFHSEITFKAPDTLAQDLQNIVNSWWGWNLKHFYTHFPKYIQLLRDTFLSDSELLQILDYDFPYESQIERCLHYKVIVSDLQFSSSKPHHLLLFCHENPNYVLKLEDLNSGVELRPLLFIVESPSVPSTFTIQLWKHGIRGKYHKSTVSFSPVIYSREIHESFLSEWNKEVGSLSVRVDLVNKNERPINVKCPELFMNYFVKILAELCNDENMELKNFRDASIPIYTLSVSMSQIPSQTQFHLTYNEREMMMNYRGHYRVEIQSFFTDILHFGLLDKESNFIYEKKLVVHQMTSLFLVGVSLYETEIFGKLISWKFSLEPFHSFSLEYTISYLLLKIYERELEDFMSSKNCDLNEWSERKLRKEFSNLITFLSSHDSRHDGFKFEKQEALLLLHSKIPFNNKVLSNYLPFKRNFESYRSYGLSQLASYPIKGSLPWTQLQAIWTNLKAQPLELLEFKEEMGSLMETYFDVSSLDNINSILQGRFLRCVSSISASFEDFGRKWADLAATMYFDRVLPSMKSLLNDSNSFSGDLTYSVYNYSKKLVSFSSVYHESILILFSDCLDSWIEVALSKAKAQVSKVLEFERGKYLSKREDCNSMEWNEGALNMNGIFNTVRLFWEELNWSNTEVHLSFGARLLEGIHEIYISYINGFHSILRLNDNVFDVTELVLILNSIHLSMTHYSKFMDSLNELIDKESYSLSSSSSSSSPSSPNSYICVENIGKFAGVLAEAQEETDSKSEEIISHFCKETKSILHNFIMNNQIHSENESDVTSLSFINKTLQYVYYHLNTSNKVKDKALRDLINSSLLNIHESEIELYYDKLKTLYIRKKRDFKVFKHLEETLPHMMDLRENLGLEPHPRLHDIQLNLYPYSKSSAFLVWSHLNSLYRNPTNVSLRGKLGFQFAYDVNYGVLVINLRHLGGLTPREGKEESHPNLSLSVLPFQANDAAQTPIYKNTTDILFDLLPSKKDHTSLRLKISSSSIDDFNFVVFKLFDHSYYMPHKYFRGMALIPWENVPKVKDEINWSEIPSSDVELKTFSMNQNSVEYKELWERKDALAKDYTQDLESYSSEERIYYNRFSTKYDWVNLTEP